MRVSALFVCAGLALAGVANAGSPMDKVDDLEIGIKNNVKAAKAEAKAKVDALVDKVESAKADLEGMFCKQKCNATQVCGGNVCVNKGALSISMTWSKAGDMDLHVLPPCGAEIFYDNVAACGGELIEDDTTGKGPETIAWASGAQHGTYWICPEAYTTDVATAVYTVTAKYQGKTVLRKQGTRGGVVDRTVACSPSFPGAIKLVI